MLPFHVPRNVPGKLPKESRQEMHALRSALFVPCGVATALFLHIGHPNAKTQAFLLLCASAAKAKAFSQIHKGCIVNSICPPRRTGKHNVAHRYARGLRTHAILHLLSFSMFFLSFSMFFLHVLSGQLATSFTCKAQKRGMADTPFWCQ